MASGLLRQEQDAGNNESHQNTGGTVAAERKAAMVNWLVEQIAQGGAERSREDKSGPEEHSARNAQFWCRAPDIGSSRSRPIKVNELLIEFLASL
jgi:hypothetical protein